MSFSMIFAYHNMLEEIDCNGAFNTKKTIFLLHEGEKWLTTAYRKKRRYFYYCVMYRRHFQMMPVLHLC